VNELPLLRRVEYRCHLLDRLPQLVHYRRQVVADRRCFAVLSNDRSLASRMGRAYASYLLVESSQSQVIKVGAEGACTLASKCDVMQSRRFEASFKCAQEVLDVQYGCMTQCLRRKHKLTNVNAALIRLITRMGCTERNQRRKCEHTNQAVNMRNFFGRVLTCAGRERSKVAGIEDIRLWRHGPHSLGRTLQVNEFSSGVSVESSTI